MADLTAPSNLYPVHDHGIFDLAIAMNSHVPSDNAVVHRASADDRAFTDNRDEGHAFAIIPVEHELRRRIAISHGPQRPTPIAQIKRRLHGAQVHVRLVLAFPTSG